MKQTATPLWIGCIADDFTGGSDAASFLRRAGLDTILINGDHLPDALPAPRPEALVVALKSRSVPAPEAVSRSLQTARWLLAQGAQHLYFKYCSTFDSTPQGNIGPVTDALLELTGEPYTVLCPSLPVNGRTVENGILYVHGVPLAESPMKDHPVNPMRKSSLPELMAEQSAYPCTALTRSQMADPAALPQLRPHHTLVPPYTSDEDGEKIAERFGHLRLLTGGSGLLQHLGARYLRDRTGRTPGPAPAGSEALPRLLLSGSCSVMTQRQVAAYRSSGGAAVRIDPAKLLSGEQTEASLLDAIDDASGDLLLYSTAGAEEVAGYQSLGAKRISALLEGLMGRLAVHGQQRGFRRIVVAGGETSGAVIQALGASIFRIGAEAAPGVPELWPVDRPGLCLILKSGNFGAKDFFLTAMR